MEVAMHSRSPSPACHRLTPTWACPAHALVIIARAATAAVFGKPIIQHQAIR